MWWWNALGTAKNADSVYRLSLTAVQPALCEFFYQSVPRFTCVMVKDWGLRETKKDCGKPGREEEDGDGVCTSSVRRLDPVSNFGSPAEQPWSPRPAVV